MWKDGFAACSTLTLGCFDLETSRLGNCTGGGVRAPEILVSRSSSSSKRLTDSIMPRRDELCDPVIGAAALRAACVACDDCG